MNLLSAMITALALLAGLVVGQQLPACPVAATLKATAKPVTAGRIAGIKLAVNKPTDWGSGSSHNLSVAINLPSNVCLVKSRVRPTLKHTTSPTFKASIVEGQNVYWLDVPFTSKGPSRRKFYITVRVSSLYTAAATVPITATVYATDETDAATCATSTHLASVRFIENCFEMWCTVGRNQKFKPLTNVE